ncbi:c-type cytochrome [Salinimonas lutimaris]|uniref:c-type cytochrome n=1 Tax=Salinimonas lutimaris TaxID=914153 RepID=UPI0010C14A5D|nr:cytochrome c [Salinimonas lutimaris]
MYRLLLLFSTLALPACDAMAQADDIKRGKALAQYCSGCHGETGIAPVQTNPNLAGQNKAYLIYALKAYRSGERGGSMAMIMRPNARQLSDDDINALATYFSSQRSNQHD